MPVAAKPRPITSYLLWAGIALLVLIFLLLTVRHCLRRGAP